MTLYRNFMKQHDSWETVFRKYYFEMPTVVLDTFGEENMREHFKEQQSLGKRISSRGSKSNKEVTLKTR